MLEKAPDTSDDNSILTIMLQLQQNGSIHSIQDQYLYWDKIKYKSGKTDPIKFWSAIKLDRKLRSKKIKFHKHTFSYVVTDYIFKSMHEFDVQMSDTVIKNGISITSEKSKYELNSIMEESISSSQIEGANTTRKRAKEMILLDKKPSDKSEVMIMNNYITMQHIALNKDEVLSIEGLLFIHKLITTNTLDNEKDEGRFRDSDDIFVVDHQNSEVVHYPPSQREIHSILNDLCTFFNDNDRVFRHPILKGCIIHFMIGWIHPFTDGNGRTARALFYWYMLKNGYLLTEYLAISRIIQKSKTQYEKAYLYTEVDNNDLSYFITYHIKILERSLEAFKENIKMKQKEKYQAAIFMKIPGVNERNAQILKLLYDKPDTLLTIKEVESRFNCSNFTARADLKTLVEKEFLDIIQVNKKERKYIKSENFDRIIESYRSKKRDSLFDSEK